MQCGGNVLAKLKIAQSLLWRALEREHPVHLGTCLTPSSQDVLVLTTYFLLRLARNSGESKNFVKLPPVDFLWSFYTELLIIFLLTVQSSTLRVHCV